MPRGWRRCCLAVLLALSPELPALAQNLNWQEAVARLAREPTPNQD